MIKITKSEKEVISRQLPNVHIVRTVKHKTGRHHYYCEENRGVLNLLDELRSNAETREAGADYGYRKTK